MHAGVDHCHAPDAICESGCGWFIAGPDEIFTRPVFIWFDMMLDKPSSNGKSSFQPLLSQVLMEIVVKYESEKFRVCPSYNTI